MRAGTFSEKCLPRTRSAAGTGFSQKMRPAKESAQLRRGPVAAAAVALATSLTATPAGADMMDMTGIEPWDICGGCHGLDGAGNHIKFPRIAGLQPAYIVKQLEDFRGERRHNDGGQMQMMAGELSEPDIARVAEWFAVQTPAWPQPTLPAPADPDRMRALASAGADGIPACLSCHSATAPALAGRPLIAPRLAGQRDFYIAKQLADFRAGRRDNDAGKVMRTVAEKLSDADIAGLAAFLSQSPELHEAAP
jgi:cytochrome c553